MREKDNIFPSLVVLAVESGTLDWERSWSLCEGFYSRQEGGDIGRRTVSCNRHHCVVVVFMSVCVWIILPLFFLLSFLKHVFFNNGKTNIVVNNFIY